MSRSRRPDAPPPAPRRRAVLAAIGAVLAAPVARAATRQATPAQTSGPFYPRTPPVEVDADLTSVAGRAPARGAHTELTGRVLDTGGRPLSGAMVEIWQCDAHGRYHHPGDDRPVPLDPGFQGYGHTRCDAAGGYRFRTIRPVAYPGRAPHIHVAVRESGSVRLVTQLYVAGAPENASDRLLDAIDAARREALLVRFEAGDAGILRAHFEMVVDRGQAAVEPPWVAWMRRHLEDARRTA
ncbi:MAG: intradiol ring-cleavage dioxygenase [Ectothiorhodospiraceae bacterium]|nr:intradiol ring-cleavage dioxygenase [Chromatiales bacterium]MCP5157293.1 intradiol ring-cleavage dioxygenase [Ectothiorhodospiraceae bacterium]